jgi:O-antigen ligase
LTASRSGFLAALVAFAGCGALLMRRHRGSVAAGALSLPAFAAAFWFLVPHETLRRIATIPEQLNRGDLNQRLNIWQAGWLAFRHSPLFGAGAGTFVDAARLAPADTAHNTVLAIAVEGGIVALILATAMVGVCAHAVIETRGPVRIALGTALLVWVITSLAATVQVSRTTWFLIALISLAARLAAEDGEALERCFSPSMQRFPLASGDNA